MHGVWEGTRFPRWGANPFLHSHSRTGAYQIVYQWSVKTFWWRCHTAFLILDVFVVFIKVEVVSVKDMANIIGCSTLTWTALLRNPAGSSWKPTSLMTPLVLQSGNVTSHRRGRATATLVDIGRTRQPIMSPDVDTSTRSCSNREPVAFTRSNAGISTEYKCDSN